MVLAFIIKLSENSDSLLILLKNELLSGNANTEKEHDYQSILVSFFQIMKSQGKS